jgi:serine/threonine protein kinase
MVKKWQYHKLNPFAMILKVSTPESIKHEIDVMEHIKDGTTEHNLVFVEEMEFESASNELTGIHGDTSTPYTRARSGLLMKQLQATLAICKIPLLVDISLRYGSEIKRAILHLDIKPSNRFLLEGICYLGEFGAATPIGDSITECIRLP